MAAGTPLAWPLVPSGSALPFIVRMLKCEAVRQAHFIITSSTRQIPRSSDPILSLLHLHLHAHTSPSPPSLSPLPSLGCRSRTTLNDSSDPLLPCNSLCRWNSLHLLASKQVGRERTYCGSVRSTVPPLLYLRILPPHRREALTDETDEWARCSSPQSPPFRSIRPSRRTPERPDA